jgi:hypothetical protein
MRLTAVTFDGYRSRETEFGPLFESSGEEQKQQILSMIELIGAGIIGPATAGSRGERLGMADGSGVTARHAQTQLAAGDWSGDRGYGVLGAAPPQECCCTMPRRKRNDR